MHPELFLTLHESLLCAFCVGTALLFDDASKATSIPNLIAQMETLEPQLAKRLRQEIQRNRQSIGAIEQLRHQVYAHRWKKKGPEDVFAEVHPYLRTMSEVVTLARFLLLEITGHVSLQKRENLERQQLGPQRLQCLADDAAQVLHGFGSIHSKTGQVEVP
jgi:hypothetical protein